MVAAAASLALLLHEPAVADHDGLAGERVRWERREEHRSLRDVLYRGELAIDRLLQHDRPDDVGLRYPERARLLRDLLLHQRGAHEARADDVGTHAMRRPFLG